MGCGGCEGVVSKSSQSLGLPSTDSVEKVPSLKVGPPPKPGRFSLAVLLKQVSLGLVGYDVEG